MDREMPSFSCQLCPPKNRTFLSIYINLWHSTNQGGIGNRKQNNIAQQETVSKNIPCSVFTCACQNYHSGCQSLSVFGWLFKHVGTSYHMVPQSATWYHIVPPRFLCHQGFCATPLGLRGYHSPLLCVARGLQDGFHDEEECEKAINLNAKFCFPEMLKWK